MMYSRSSSDLLSSSDSLHQPFTPRYTTTSQTYKMEPVVTSQFASQSEIYGELFSCLDDIHDSMREQLAEPAYTTDPAVDAFIHNFCLEHFMDVEEIPLESFPATSPADDTQPSTELLIDQLYGEITEEPYSSPVSVCPTTPLDVPEDLDSHLEDVSPGPLPFLSSEDIDLLLSTPEPMAAQECGYTAGYCDSPDSGYSSICSPVSDTSALSMVEMCLSAVPQPDFSSPLPVRSQDYYHSQLPSLPVGYQTAQSVSAPHTGPTELEKPEVSYIAMIAKAIMTSREGRLLLGDIYKYILDNYPYYHTAKHSWRNSIRHNLSTNGCFIKCGRARNGKGFYWSIHAACLEAFQAGDFDRRLARRQVQHSVTLKNHFTPAVRPSSSPSLTLVSSSHTGMAYGVSTPVWQGQSQRLGHYQ